MMPVRRNFDLRRCTDGMFTVQRFNGNFEFPKWKRENRFVRAGQSPVVTNDAKPIHQSDGLNLFGVSCTGPGLTRNRTDTSSLT
ncbi:unnamed protein product [Nesidiocoris tenuis]|uniref:Uncharacterized protein n=1 Tax=Nesidiocoris tenuis TaxID=355587 RepID=A0A6H5GZZ3_9HEMI|nr:unnamed protein product [Nesidiocoris tenuis]